MRGVFDIRKFDSYKEDNRREVKRANGGLPSSLWETYSAFANTYGGVIILGIKEMDDRSWRTTGLKRAEQEKLLDDIVIVIYVPMARREQKPIFINDDLFGGTFRRAYTGDYHCTKLQVKAMLRDQTENTMDMELLDEVPLDDLTTKVLWHIETAIGHCGQGILLSA